MFRTPTTLVAAGCILVSVLAGGYVRQAALGRMIGLGVGLIVAAGAIARRDGYRRLRAAAEAYAANAARSDRELTALNAKITRAAHEWRTTVDTLDAALIVFDPDGAILRMNLAAAATLPGGLGDWLGRPTRDLAGHQPWTAALALVEDAVSRHTVTTTRSSATGGRTWDLSCRALPIRQPPAVLVLARDVTEIVDLQESVKRSETMAALGSIVVGVAHEVRNPLFAISSLVDAWALQPHRDPSPFVDALRSEVARLRTLMLELLEYGRPVCSTLCAQEVGRVIESAIRACAHEAEARHVRIVTTDGGHGSVLMDPPRLERVFINLMQNAVQHAPDGSVVNVATNSTSDDGSAIEVAISDRGPGFEPSDLTRVFSPFFSRRPGGFGLGLAITERIVTEHHGKVAAANNPSGGAIMTVRLPLAPRGDDAMTARRPSVQEPIADR